VIWQLSMLNTKIWNLFRESLSYRECSRKASLNACAFIFLLWHLLWATDTEKTLSEMDHRSDCSSVVLMITEEWNEISK